MIMYSEIQLLKINTVRKKEKKGIRQAYLLEENVKTKQKNCKISQSASMKQKTKTSASVKRCLKK